MCNLSMDNTIIIAPSLATSKLCLHYHMICTYTHKYDTQKYNITDIMIVMCDNVLSSFDFKSTTFLKQQVSVTYRAPQVRDKEEDQHS